MYWYPIYPMYWYPKPGPMGKKNTCIRLSHGIVHRQQTNLVPLELRKLLPTVQKPSLKAISVFRMKAWFCHILIRETVVVDLWELQNGVPLGMTEKPQIRVGNVGRDWRHFLISLNSSWLSARQKILPSYPAGVLEGIGYQKEIFHLPFEKEKDLELSLREKSP